VNTDWRRRRVAYGAGYHAGGAAPPIPDWGRRLADWLFADIVTDEPFDPMLVNVTYPGRGSPRIATTPRMAGCSCL
jgi:hypothetical protein